MNAWGRLTKGTSQRGVAAGKFESERRKETKDFQKRRPQENGKIKGKDEDRSIEKKKFTREARLYEGGRNPQPFPPTRKSEKDINAKKKKVDSREICLGVFFFFFVGGVFLWCLGGFVLGVVWGVLCFFSGFFCCVAVFGVFWFFGFLFGGFLGFFGLWGG